MSTPTKRGPKKWPKWKAHRVSESAWFYAHWAIGDHQLDAIAERMAKELCGSILGMGDWSQRRDLYKRIVHDQFKSIGLVAKKGKL